MGVFNWFSIKTVRIFSSKDEYCRIKRNTTTFYVKIDAVCYAIRDARIAGTDITLLKVDFKHSSEMEVKAFPERANS
jgi:hypothetical protein